MEKGIVVPANPSCERKIGSCNDMRLNFETTRRSGRASHEMQGREGEGAWKISKPQTARQTPLKQGDPWAPTSIIIDVRHPGVWDKLDTTV